MIGSIIGAGVSAIGSIWGGAAKAKAMKRAKKNLEAQQAKNDAWYNRRYNEDTMQLAASQAAMRQAEESIRNRTRQSQGMAAVGSTEEAQAVAREANAAALANTASNIAVAGQSRKDNVESTYLNRDAQVQQGLRDMEIGKANAIAQATEGVSQAAMSIGNAIDGKK
ncbi:hypothetical protein [Paramuribaculum intestinale]|uniref:hypothetical protein n=1 Tax=Paramuribaculum intestinale TaxID=2094151 RepID=UPI0025AF982D|nr:hypothetical protein [Paramuribaculum intestinale]